MDRIQCSFCELKFKNSSFLKQHFLNDHQLRLSSKDTTSFICKTDNCLQTFTTSKRLLEHIDKYHCLHNENANDNTNVNKIKPSESSWNATKVSLAPAISEMIADLRLNTNVSGTDFSRFVDSVENITTSVMSQVTTKVQEFFKYKGIDILANEMKIFLDQFDVKPSFSEYKDMKGQIGALKKQYNFIEAKEMTLGQTEQIIKDKETGNDKIHITYDHFYYISIIDTLTLILSNEEVFKYINNSETFSDGRILRNYVDGENYNNNPFFKKYSKALGIHLYFDEFLVNNPLGSKTYGQKIGAFYFSLENLPPHLKDYIGNVHVLMLCYNKDIKKYTINKILSPFVNEMKLLQGDNGCAIKIGEIDFTLRCTLLSVSADTLAAHELLGFLSPAANLFCRSCTITREEFHRDPCTVAAERTKEYHEQCCREIVTTKAALTLTGVKCNTILNDLQYFHCTQNYNFDIMHDILEGQGHFALKLVIAHMISHLSYNLNVNMLNHRIKNFDYGRAEEKNKPTANLTSQNINNVNSDHKLQERAVQMWCFLRIFPFLVADKVPSNDPYLEYIINLNKIIEILFVPQLPYNILPYLHELIIHHVQKFKVLFPEVNPINKLHHMLHYAKCIEKSGPLRHLACFKHEAKHQMFKKYGSICCNYKNILKSMTNISQMSQCSIWGTGRKEIRKKLQCTFQDIEDISEHSNIMEILIRENIKPKETLKMVDKVEVYSIKYEINLFVAIDSGEGNYTNMPKFGKIVQILIIDGEVYLYCKEWISNYLEETLNAYCVTEAVNFILISTDKLCDPKPFSLWQTFSSNLKYICLRHLLFDK